MNRKVSSPAAPAKPVSRQQPYSGSYAGIEQHPAVRQFRKHARPNGLGFQIRKIGHVVLNCRDLERSVKFYTEVLGFQISDVYPEEMVPGGMVFLRCNTDHHGIGLVGTLGMESSSAELNHIAFEVGTLDEVLLAAGRLRECGATIDFEGRRRAGVQIAVEFRDPDGHRLEIYWGIDQVGSEGNVRPPAEWKGAHSFREAIENPVRGQDTTLRDPSLLDRLARGES
jgi:catechol 2,3-dioxygenase-like lactoylglutathione lyase family enzyme